MEKVAFCKSRIDEIANEIILDNFLEKIASNNYEFDGDNKASYFKKHKRDILIGAGGATIGALGYKNRHLLRKFGKKNKGKFIPNDSAARPSWVDVQILTGRDADRIDDILRRRRRIY